MKTAIIDTSVWISLLFDSDKRTVESEKIFDELKAGGYQILVPAVVLVEICATAKRELKKGYRFHQVLKSVEKMGVKYLDIKMSDLFKLLTAERYNYIKSGDFYVLLYCLKFKPDKLVSFDIKQQEVYNLFNSKNHNEKIQKRQSVKN